MAYIGLPPKANFTSGLLDRFTSTTGTTVTLTHDISSENDIVVFVNFVKQDSTTYSVGGTGNKTLTLGGTLVSSDIVEVHYLNIVGQTVNPSANSVGSSQLTADSITGQTAETSIADDDTIIIHDTSASALRKMTKANFTSGIGGDNTPMFLVSGGSGSQTINHASGTTITYNQEIIDTDNAFASNIFTVPSGKAGKYFFSASCFIEDAQNAITRYILEIQKNNSSWRQIAHRFTSNNDLKQVGHTITAIDDASVSDEYKAKVYVETNDGGSVFIENLSTSYSNNWFQGFKLL